MHVNRIPYMYPGTVPMRNCARPVIHRIQEFRPVLTARAAPQPARDAGEATERAPGAVAHALAIDSGAQRVKYQDS